MLTSGQIEAFKRDGVLVLRGFFDRDTVDRWRREIFEYFGQPGDGDSWRSALQIHKSDNFYLSDDPTPATHPELARVYGALHRSARWDGENELVIRPANEPARWCGARAPHLDFPLYTPVRTLANNVIYLSDVEERGGAFMYWPGSHQTAWQYFRRRPQDYLSRGDRPQDDTFAILKAEMTGDPVEHVGEAGDLLIWNSLLLHSASVNKRDEPRLAIFGRWGVDRGDDEIYDFDDDMWRYWEFSAGAGKE
jgi:hypothetical protein